jgi:hypothetical protein
VLEAEKHPRLDVTSVTERIRGFQARYELDSIVIDGRPGYKFHPRVDDVRLDT